MQVTGFQKFTIISINPNQEWLNKIDEEWEEYAFEEDNIKCCRVDVYFKDNKEDVFKYSFVIKDEIKEGKSGAIKYINCTGDVQWVNSETQLWDSFKQWEKVLSWQKNGTPVTKWESGSVPLEKQIVAKKAWKVCLIGEDDLLNLWKAIYFYDKMDTSINLLLDMNKLFNNDFSELIIPNKDFHVTAFLYVSSKQEQKVHKVFFSIDFIKDVNNNMSISNYNKKPYQEFLTSLEYVKGDYQLGRMQEFKKEFIKTKIITEDEGDY